MTKILCIETATSTCSVAIHEDTKLLIHHELLKPYSHAQALTTIIQQQVELIGTHLTQLDAIAISKGPGSYTGLRIGVATAKGLCYALNKPLIAINTLEAMAYQVIPLMPHEALVCPMIDARRMEVYCSIWNKETNNILPTQAKIIDNNSFDMYLAQQPIIFIGDGIHKCKSLLNHTTNAIFWDNIRPSATTIGYLAFQAFKNNNFEDIAYFEPFYLKDFVTTNAIKL